MNFIERWAERLTVKEARHNLDLMVESLSGMDGPEVAVTVIFATTARNGFPDPRVDLLEPLETMTRHPGVMLDLRRMLRHAQKTPGLEPAGTAMLVWVNTLNAALYPQLTRTGREMWRHMARGFPHVTRQVWSLDRITTGYLNIEGFDRIPRGLEPAEWEV